jgi:hypothetical protein
MRTYRSRVLRNLASHVFLFGFCSLTALESAGCGYALAQNADTVEPSSHQQDISIGDSLLKAATVPLHILYLHGIGAVNAGDSYVLRKKICDFLKDCTSRKEK